MKLVKELNNNNNKNNQIYFLTGFDTTQYCKDCKGIAPFIHNYCIMCRDKNDMVMFGK